MKLTRAELHQVVVPVPAERVSTVDAFGPPIFDEVPKLILELHTDGGPIGLGETYRGVGRGAIEAALRRLAGRDLLTLSPQSLPLVDHDADPFTSSRTGCLDERIYDTGRLGRGPWYDAVEMAVLDLIGKHAGLSVAQLLGGPVRDGVRAYGWFMRLTAEDGAGKAKALKDQGYRGVKYKCRLEDDVANRALAIAEACGDAFGQVIDPNERFYRPAEAIPVAKALEHLPNVVFESPFRQSRFDWYVLMRAKTTVPLALHIGARDALHNAIHYGACDYLNLGGSLYNFVGFARAADVAGMPCWHGSGVDLGIAEAAYLHAAAASPACTLPSDVFGRLVREHNLIDRDFRPDAEGRIPVPEGPGLGVNLDRDALDRYATGHWSLELG